jgi:DNA-binding NarL/FixJ family response regulator
MPHGTQNVRLLQRAAEVDKLRRQGKSIKDISLRLKVSERTVRRSLDLLKK